MSERDNGKAISRFDDGINPECFVLEKVVWSKYDMTLTRENVDLFLNEYFEAKSICFKTLFLSKMTSTIDPNKIFVPSIVNNGGHADKVNEKVDAESIIINTEPLLNEVLKTFTPKEKLYYEYCLINKYSEDYIMEKFGNISKNGLLPIKNSCILKLALVFEIAVLK